jgi:hypothetical protein
MFTKILSLSPTHHYQCMTDVTNVIPLGRFFDTTIIVDNWYHAFTYIPAHHGFVRPKRDAISFVMVGLLYDIANAHVQSKIKHPHSPHVLCFTQGPISIKKRDCCNASLGHHLLLGNEHGLDNRILLPNKHSVT